MKPLCFKFLSIALIAIFMVSCSDDEGTPPNPKPTPTLAAQLSADSEFSILVDALGKTGLDAALDAEGTFTVFAPNNAAFEALFVDLGVSDLDGAISLVGSAQIKTILEYHVLDTTLSQSNLSTGYVTTMAANSQGNNMSAYVAKSTGLMINDIATVITANIQASNGVAHELDAVLMPATLYDLIEVNPNYSSLETLSKLSGGNFDLTLSDETKVYTLFAPDNEAFDTLMAYTPNVNNLADLAADLGQQQLTTLILYHVTNSNLRANDLSIGSYTSAASNGTGGFYQFNVNINNGIYTISDLSGLSPNARLELTNITAVNGTMHGITNVLLFQ